MTAKPWQRAAARATWPLLGVVVGLWVAARVFVPAPPELALLDPPPWHVAMAAYGVIGAVIVSRRPDNVVGWLFFAVGVFDPLAAAVRAVALSDSPIVSRSLADVAAWVQAWVWSPSLGALALLMWLFPTGHALPGAWQWGKRLTMAATATLFFGGAVVLWPHRGFNLLLDESVPGLAGTLMSAGFTVLMLSAAWAIVSLAVRFRRAHGEERQQLKWFVYGAVLVTAQAFTDIVVLDGLGIGDSMLRETLSAVALLVVPVTAAIAVLRYRLYDIDRLINRTVVYGALTAGCAGVYLAVVAVVRVLTQPVIGDTNVAVAVSTLAVAALFRPARRRVQAAVDRRFNRARYDAAQTVGYFSGRLRHEVDLGSLREELLTAVDRTVQPTRAALWLKPSAR